MLQCLYKLSQHEHQDHSTFIFYTKKIRVQQNHYISCYSYIYTKKGVISKSNKNTNKTTLYILHICISAINTSFADIFDIIFINYFQKLPYIQFNLQ